MSEKSILWSIFICLILFFAISSFQMDNLEKRIGILEVQIDMLKQATKDF
jgi:hypothetical protein